MNKDSIIDYLSCILLKSLGPVIRSLPLDFALFFGRRIGDLFYYFDLRHKAIAYANIKTALGNGLFPAQISGLTKKFYHNFGQNIIEIFLIPVIDKTYLEKNITFEGLKFIEDAFKIGKGAILVSVHAGSWELSNIICANLGFPFLLFVREQRYPRLSALLNSYRMKKGCRIIKRQGGLKHLIQALKENTAIGMTADQGGKEGILVKFFGKDASMPTGAIKLALKYDAVIIPVFYTRIQGPKFRVIIEPAFKLERTGNPETDIHTNLQRLVGIFEKYILRYPQDYLWTYKIWKYALEKDILILSDGKIGHLRQAQAAANIVSNYFKDKDITVRINTAEVKFKNRLAKTALIVSSCLGGKYNCQGCLWCLRKLLEEDSYESLINKKADIIISCGSSLAPVNSILSRENLSKSIMIMRPSFLSTRKFDLVVIPRHDHPPKRKNVVITEGALNLINQEYLKEQADKLIHLYGFSRQSPAFYIGLLIGGDTRHFHLDKDTLLEVIRQIKSVSEKLNANTLVTTSRRTSPEIEGLVKEEFQDWSRSKLLIIANEKNIPEAMGGILGLSRMVVVSPESISMISEAASAGRYTLVFKSQVDLKHQYFLQQMYKKEYIYLCGTDELAACIEKLNKDNPAVRVLKDDLIVKEALRRVI